MRGRDLYKLAEPLVRTTEKVVAILPRVVRSAVLDRMCSNSDSLLARAVREVLLRSLAADCGSIVDVRRFVVLKGIDSLHLGSRVSIHPFTYIDATGGLEIGSDVSIAHGVTIMTTEHDFTSTDIAIRDQGVTMAAVNIGDDVWIGAGAKILAGCTIGEHSVVAAGSVVTKDVAPMSVVAGVPAKLIRYRQLMD